MVYELTEKAKEVATPAQIEALWSLLRWDADKIRVGVDFEVDTKETHHGKGWFLTAAIDKDEKTIYFLGVAPNGDMHS